MISQTVLETLRQYVPAENIRFHEPMHKHTTFKIGGDAYCFIEVTEKTGLSKLVDYLDLVEIPYFVMGNGSNILVSDRGYDGVILHIADGMTNITVTGERMAVGAGVSMAKAARTAAECGLTGLEFAAGIPGTVGGGIVMNAGAYDGEMKQVVESVSVIDRGGNELILDNETMEFGYRTSIIKKKPFLVTGCTFRLRTGNQEEIYARMEDFQKRRKEKQPLEFPSAGSTFKRPVGNFAGKLIMDAGLRGFSIGGARVSDKHCGFVINTGNATASDVHDLIMQVIETVYEKFQVRLEPEVIFLGEF